MRPSAGPSRRCLLVKMFAPVASSPFKRSVRMGSSSIRIATPSFPMGSGPQKERSSNSPPLDTAAVCELFRRLLLRRLHKEERLSERFTENLLSWVHPGFSVFAGEPLSRRCRATWSGSRDARLIQKIFEVDSLQCVCGAEMKIVFIITDPRVVDRIFRHLESQACRARDPFEPRALPQAGGNSSP